MAGITPRIVKVKLWFKETANLKNDQGNIWDEIKF